MGTQNLRSPGIVTRQSGGLGKENEWPGILTSQITAQEQRGEGGAESGLLCPVSMGTYSRIVMVLCLLIGLMSPQLWRRGMTEGGGQGRGWWLGSPLGSRKRKPWRSRRGQTEGPLTTPGPYLLLPSHHCPHLLSPFWSQPLDICPLIES